jgi:ABC-type multidrug transport system fused ATPase/permease subunit
MQELDSSVVHRNLDTKLKIAGLEALDLLLVLVLSAIMGLFFDGGKFGFIFIFILPITLLVSLFLIKRSKPDGYIKDILKFYITRGHYSASEELKNQEKIKNKMLIRKNKNG